MSWSTCSVKRRGEVKKRQKAQVFLVHMTKNVTSDFEKRSFGEMMSSVARLQAWEEVVGVKKGA